MEVEEYEEDRDQAICNDGFKAGEKKVAEWVNKNGNKAYIYEGTYTYDTKYSNQLLLDLGDWQNFLKSEGIE